MAVEGNRPPSSFLGAAEDMELWLFPHMLQEAWVFWVRISVHPAGFLLGLEEPELTDFRKHVGGLGVPPGPEPRVPLTDLEIALVPPWASVLSSQGLRCPICIMGI